VPFAPKDYSKLPYFIAGVRENIDVETIHVITPDPTMITEQWPDVVFDADADVFPYDRRQLRHRPNWCFQMIAKIFQDVTEHDWFVVMDGDIIANNTIPLWSDDGKPIFCLGRDRRAMGAYFNFNRKMLGYGQVYPRSFLTECVLYNKQLVRAMMRACGCDNLDDWWAKCVEITDRGCHIADAEFYGSYVVHDHPDVYEFRDIKTTLGGKYDLDGWTVEEIESHLQGMRTNNPGAHLISLHTWADWDGDVRN
jgi:hypothetical protein